MALLFCDSFDHYTTAQLTRKWSAAAAAATIAAVGRNGTSGLNVVGGNSAVKNFPSNLATVVVGVAVKVSNSALAARFLRLQDAGSVQVELEYRPDGAIMAFRNGTTIGTTAPGVMLSPSAQHNYVEIKTTIHDTTGSLVLRVNEQTVLTLTNVDTKNTANAYVTQLWLGESLSNSNTVQFDDVYICDTAGSVNNDFLGDVRIQCLYPSGAGGSTQFTPSTGSNYQCVDETTPNDDTDYVSSSTVGHKDTYAFADLSAATTAVVAVVATTTDRKDDGGTRTHAHVLNDGTEAVGAAFSPGTAYTAHQTVFETKPSGGAWDAATVNALEGGHKIVT